MSLKSTNILLQVGGGEEKALGAGSTTASFPGTPPLFTGQVNLTDGTGTNKAQKVGVGGFSLTGGASVTFDLTAFPGPFGNVNFSSVKYCHCENPSPDATNILELGDAASNPWTSPFAGTNPRVKVSPTGVGGAPLVIPAPLAGFAVAGGNKNVKITNVGAGTNAVNGNLVVIGEGT